MIVTNYGAKVEITTADKQALRRCLQRSKEPVSVDHLAYLLRKRIAPRVGLGSWTDTVRHAAGEAVTRLLSGWKSEGLATNPVRGRWAWVATQGNGGRRKAGKRAK